MGRVTFALVTLLVVASSSAAAQRVTITPTTGAYLPLRDQGQLGYIVDDTWTSSGFYAVGTTGLDPAFDMGVKFSVDFSSLLAIEASVTTARPQRTYTWLEPNSDPSFFGLGYGAVRTTAVSFQAVLLRPVGPQTDVGITAGVTRIAFGGSVPPGWAPRAAGPSLGARIRRTLSPRTILDVNVVHAWYAPEGMQKQRDLFVSAGIGIILMP